MKKIILLVCTISIFASSCSNDESNHSSNVFVKEIKSIDPNDYNPDSRLYTYEYVGNKIKREDHIRAGVYVIYTYNLNLIVKKEYFYSVSNVLFKMDKFFYNSNSDLISSVYLNIELGFATRRDFIINNNIVSYELYNGNLISQDDFQGSGTYTFDSNEIVEYKYNYEDLTGQIITKIWQYTYDDSNNPFKNVLGFEKISFLVRGLGVYKNITTSSFYSIPANNILSQNFVNTYNVDNNLVTCTMNDSEGGFFSIEYVYFE